jgi:hypothetical protein
MIDEKHLKQKLLLHSPFKYARFTFYANKGASTTSFILILRKPREGQAAVQPRQGLLSPKVIHMYHKKWDMGTVLFGRKDHRLESIKNIVAC